VLNLNLKRKEVISMKKMFVIGAGVVLGLALVATVALAFGPWSGPESRPGFGPAFAPGFAPGFGRGFGGPTFSALPITNLTAEQSAKIQALRDGFLKEIEPLQKELYTKQAEMQSLWAASNPDKAAIESKQKKIATLQSQLQEKAINLGLEMRKVLLPEQLAQLPAFGQGTGFGPGPGFGRRGSGPYDGVWPHDGHERAIWPLVTLNRGVEDMEDSLPRFL
jgi:Spy/CpxP family protein refolding chaperone